MTKEAHQPDPGQDDAFIGEGPAGDANPGGYMSNDQQRTIEEDAPRDE